MTKRRECNEVFDVQQTTDCLHCRESASEKLPRSTCATSDSLIGLDRMAQNIGNWSLAPKERPAHRSRGACSPRRQCPQSATDRQSTARLERIRFPRSPCTGRRVGEIRLKLMTTTSWTSGRRIAIMTSSLAGGGAERKAILLASGLQERGHTVDLLLEHLYCDYAKELPRGVRLFYLRRGTDQEAQIEHLPTVPTPLIPYPMPYRARFARSVLATRLPPNQLPLLAGRRAPRWAVGVAGYLDSAQPDAVLAMQVIGVVAATMAMHLTLRPVGLVATAHNRFDKRRLIRRGRRAYPLANVAIGVSQGVSNDLAGIIKVPIDRVHAI